MGIKELARPAHRVLLAVEKALVVLGGQKRRLVMVEPPGNPGRRGVFEVHNGVFVAGKLALVKERSGAMHQAVIFIAGFGRNALTMESGEQRRRASSVETFVVIEDANSQGLPSLCASKVKNRNC